MKIPLMAIGLILCLELCAQQDKATLKLYISPPPETILVNDSVLSRGNRIALDEGQHRLRFWAPGYELTDTILTLQAGETMNFFFHQQESKHYLEYVARHDKFVSKRRLHLDLPLLTTGLLLASTTYFYISAQNSYDATGEALENYRYASTSLDESYATYQEMTKQYRKDMVLFYAQAGLTVVSGYFLYRGFKWLKKHNGGPEYEPEKNPLVLNNIYLAPGSRGNSGIQIGLNFSLN